jgi:hypothetical protein
MINQMTGYFRAMRSSMSPGALIDLFLDRIEKLSVLVLPAQADKPPYDAAEIRVRVKRFRA